MWLVVIIVIIFVIVLIYLYIVTHINAYTIINKWNYHITPERDKQNLSLHMRNAATCGIKSVRKLNKLLVKHHDQIITELQTLLKKGYRGYPMAKIDEVQRDFVASTGNERLWSPIWIKFMDTWAGTARHLPTLADIVEEVGDDILLLHISVFWSGTELAMHRGISMSVMRYHYGLIIPEGDTALQVGHQVYKWKPKQGIIWDDTIPHAAWNRTNQARFIIFADIHRPFSGLTRRISRFVHSKVQALKHVKSIAHKLEREGIHID